MSNRIICATPQQVTQEVMRLYNEETRRLVDAWQKAIKGDMPTVPVQAWYPKISVYVTKPPIIYDRKIAFGFCHRPGVYKNTVTRPDLFADYWEENLALIQSHHPNAEISVDLSEVEIPVAFALNETALIKGKMNEETANQVKPFFTHPDPRSYINHDGSQVLDGKTIFPLTWYNGPRTDKMLNQLRHHTGTNPQFFQSKILFTNYEDYIEEFIKAARESLQASGPGDDNPYIALVQPGNVIEWNKNISNIEGEFSTASGTKPKRLPQMPAYHLVRKDGTGITIINIGVGPSNAKTITDELAVLRPEAWMMVGHCAGLSYTQRVGDYVIPNGFVFEDGLTEKILSTNIDIPELSEMHRAIKEAAKQILGEEGQEDDFEASVRTGIITTTNDRNWEVPNSEEELHALERKFGLNRSIALEMETGTIAAQGFLHRVSYGGILCVSDRPLHGEPKLPGTADDFYRSRVAQQFKIAMRALENLDQYRDRRRTRKLTSDYAHVPMM